MFNTEYSVTGMTCEHCERAVRDEVSAIPGVISATASRADGTLTVVSENPIDDADVLAAVDEAGYTAKRA